MRIRKRSLFPLPPISYSLALLNLPSKNQTPQRQQQQKHELRTTTTAAAAAARGGEEGRVRRGMQGLHLKGDHPQQHMLPKYEDEDEEGGRSTTRTTPEFVVTVLKKRNGCISSRSSLPPNPYQTLDGRQVKVEEDEERLTAIQSHNHNSKSWAPEGAAGHWLLSPSFASSSSSSSSRRHHHHQAGRWFQAGEEASLKRSRDGSTKGVDQAEKLIMTREKKGNARKRRMIEKKYFNGENEETEEEKDGGDDSTELLQKKGNGSNSNSSSSGGGSSRVMEGSRCSRANGRGWRCCQQTLVGYALCEHHLRKGRLRSMLNIPSRSLSTAVAAPPPPSGDDEGSLSSLPREQQREDGDGGWEEKLMVTKEKKKRKRVGTVKARSISSLLGQTHRAATEAVAALTPAPATAIALASNLSSKNNSNSNN